MKTTNSSYSYYIKQIKDLPVLSRDEERQLLEKVNQGDLDAKNRLVICNLKFVITVAKRYVNEGLSFMDLISEGNIGLLKAIEMYDLDKEVRLISYAVHWIKQSIIKAIAEKSNIAKLPLKANNYMVAVKKEMHNHAYSDLSEEIIEKVSRNTGISVKYMNTMMPFFNYPLSLEMKQQKASLENNKMI